MLNEAKYFSWKNYSVPEHDPFDEEEDLKRALEGQIRPVNAVIIIAGMYANHSDWIEFEVKFAHSLSKMIAPFISEEKKWFQDRSSKAYYIGFLETILLWIFFLAFVFAVKNRIRR